MERVWRTMRSRCTDYLPGMSTRHDVDVSLWAWLDADYHRKPHASLLGETPRKRYLAGKQGRPLTPAELARALEVTNRRQVRKDGTFSIDSVVYEVEGRHLFSRRIDVVIDGLTGRVLRVVYEGKPVRFNICDPLANRHRKRGILAEPATSDLRFDPITNLLQKAREVDGE